jgi:hypothetical protein
MFCTQIDPKVMQRSLKNVSVKVHFSLVYSIHHRGKVRLSSHISDVNHLSIKLDSMINETRSRFKNCTPPAAAGGTPRDVSNQSTFTAETNEADVRASIYGETLEAARATDVIRRRSINVRL